jgi:copper homeostasis protein
VNPPTPSARRILCEVCVDSVDGALAAEAGGAHRLELCGPLALGGLTPTIGLVREVRRKCSLPIHAMLRPHARDFCYTAFEVDVMLADLQCMLDEAVDGFVVGPLTQDDAIDVTLLGRFCEYVKPTRLNFHRAFDEVRDFDQSLQQLIDLGIARILTSGGMSNAQSGSRNIRRWIESAGDRLVVMPGGGVTPENVTKILAETGAREIHFSGRVTGTSTKGVKFSPSPVSWQVTSAERVAEIVGEAQRAFPVPL